MSKCAAPHFYISRANRNFSLLVGKKVAFRRNRRDGLKSIPCDWLQLSKLRDTLVSNLDCIELGDTRLSWLFFFTFSNILIYSSRVKSWFWNRVLFSFMNYNAGLCIRITEGYAQLKSNLRPILTPWKKSTLFSKYCYATKMCKEYDEKEQKLLRCDPSSIRLFAMALRSLLSFAIAK